MARSLSQAGSPLLRAVVGNSNSGLAGGKIDSRVLENGQGPVMLEPATPPFWF